MVESSENSFNLSTKNRRSISQDKSLFILQADFDRKYLDYIIAIENHTHSIVIDQRVKHNISQSNSTSIGDLYGYITSGCMMSDVDYVLCTQQGHFHLFDIRMTNMPIRSVCITDTEPFTNRKYTNYVHQIQNVGSGNLMVSYSSSGVGCGPEWVEDRRYAYTSGGGKEKDKSSDDGLKVGNLADSLVERESESITGGNQDKDIDKEQDKDKDNIRFKNDSIEFNRSINRLMTFNISGFGSDDVTDVV